MLLLASRVRIELDLVVVMMKTMMSMTRVTTASSLTTTTLTRMPVGSFAIDVASAQALKQRRAWTWGSGNNAGRKHSRSSMAVSRSELLSFLALSHQTWKPRPPLHKQNRRKDTLTSTLRRRCCTRRSVSARQDLSMGPPLRSEPCLLPIQTPCSRCRPGTLIRAPKPEKRFACRCNVW